LLTLRTAGVIHVAGNLLRAFGGKPIEPINHFSIAATRIDEAGEAIATVAPALLTTHAQHIELADKISEDDCAVAGHKAQGHRDFDNIRKVRGRFSDNDVADVATLARVGLIQQTADVV
jgi:hypothetical protein